MSTKKERKSLNLAWVASVDMGLGHKRAAFPLDFLAKEHVLIVGSDAETDVEERKQWTQLRHAYEQLSRLKSVPIIGNQLFGIMDYILQIPPAYPKRDYSAPSFQVNYIMKRIAGGLCRTMLRMIKADPAPLISTFYAPALAADKAGLSRVYCVITDTDLNRVWVAPVPRESRIEYLVPCGNAVRRLHQYGIPDDRIFLTGFPLPLELLGNPELDVLRRDLGARLHRLDPQKRFWPLHERNVVHFLGEENCKEPEDKVLTVSFAVGGAGAQREIGVAGLRALAPRLMAGTVRMNLVCGVRTDVREFFRNAIKEIIPEGKGVQLIYGDTDDEYFTNFNNSLHKTDILWTKPSELSFYVGLGIPLVMSTPLGAQEEKNKRWLLEVQAGIDQHAPEAADQWLFDMIDQGRLADLAWNGFLKARKYGTYKIKEVLETGTMTRETSPLRR